MIGATEEIVLKQIYVCVYKIIKRIIKKNALQHQQTMGIMKHPQQQKFKMRWSKVYISSQHPHRSPHTQFGDFCALPTRTPELQPWPPGRKSSSPNPWDLGVLPGALYLLRGWGQWEETLASSLLWAIQFYDLWGALRRTSASKDSKQVLVWKVSPLAEAYHCKWRRSFYAL